jgi:anti-sigma regulatory factor (Ser/Thr protein kinase)
MTTPLRHDFPGKHDQVACAREFIRDATTGCPVQDEAILLTSELCTNALQHTASGNGGTFEVTIQLRPGSMRVEVRDDGSPSTPALQSVSDLAEDGRGLEIVALLAHRWGQTGDEYGRSVYFELRWDPA